MNSADTIFLGIDAMAHQGREPEIFTGWKNVIISLKDASKRFPFEIWLNPNTTREVNISKLKQAGLKSAVTGIESASEETRKKVYLRTESTEDTIKADRILSKYGIRKTYDFIIDHPWECQTELHDTFEFALNMKKPFELNMHSLVLLPGTELAKRAIRENLSTE